MDRQAWRDFFVTVFLLGLAFVIAVLSSIAAQQGDIRLGAIAAAVSLLVAIVGAVYIIPRLARRVQLEFIRFAVRTSVTVEGIFFVLLLVVIGFAAWNTANNLLYLILSAMLAFLFAANLISRLTLSDLSLQLRFPDHIFAREPANISIAVTNHKRLMPGFSLMIEPLSEANQKPKPRRRNAKPDDSNDAPPKQTVFSEREEDGVTESKSAASPKPKNSGDVKSGKSSKNRGLGRLAHFILVPPRSTATHQVEYTFEDRGVYPITSFKVSTKFPTGFFKKWRKIDATGEIVVYPKPRPLDDFYHTLPMLTGQISSHSRGSGDDLYSIRRYHPSDHIRNIDWKATAKASELMVRDHMREDERRLTIVFDTSRPEQLRIGAPVTVAQAAGTARDSQGSDSTWFEQTFERAIVMAASLANHFVLEGAEVELITTDEENGVESGKGIEHLYRILRSLAKLEPCDKDRNVETDAESGSVAGRSFADDGQATGDSVGSYALSRRSRARLKQAPDVKPDRRNAPSLLEMLGEIRVLSDERRFKVLITPAAKGTIPANIWRSAHVVFMEDLKEDRAAPKTEPEAV